MKALPTSQRAFLKTSSRCSGAGVLLAAALVLLAALALGLWAEKPPAAMASPVGDAGLFGGVWDVDGAEADQRSGKVAVQLKPGAALPDLRAVGLTGARPLGMGNIYVLDLMPSGMSEEDVLAWVESLPGVEWAEGEVSRVPCLVPDDPFFNPNTHQQLWMGQWGLHRVGLPQAWETTTGAPEIIVAIIDTGINKDLPDFAGRIVHPCSVEGGVPRTAWPAWQDIHGHGTGVAGVAVARGGDGQGMAGAAWDVKIMPVKMGNEKVTDIALAMGIKWAVDHGADVINVSFAGDASSPVEDEAVKYALDRGVPIVAAAGNDPRRPMGFPAGLRGVIGVAAIDERDLSHSSSGGSGLDLSAPGAKIITWGKDPKELRLAQGTSFAAPLVSGTVALMLSVDPTLSPAKISSVLARTADDLGPSGWDMNYGWGVLDAGEAVTMVAADSGKATPPGSVPEGPFRDVSPADTPYVRQIEALAGLGVVEGKGDKRFEPNDGVLRQQFAKMIVLTMGYPVSQADTAEFCDIKPDNGKLYPYHYVAVAWKKGITLGTGGGCFSPGKGLTRAQMITMVARAAGFPEPPEMWDPGFPDFSKDHYPHARRAAYAHALGSLQGMGPSYDFFAPASRGDVCALLYEVLR